jgi:hypothetical protein
MTENGIIRPAFGSGRALRICGQHLAERLRVAVRHVGLWSLAIILVVRTNVRLGVATSPLRTASRSGEASIDAGYSL